MFLIALGMIMGAAIVDLSLIVWQRAGSAGARRAAPTRPTPTSRPGLEARQHRAACVALGRSAGARRSSPSATSCWASRCVYLVVALLLVFVFALVNGISLGISDSNPISSAFVVAVVIMAAIGLKDPAVGLMAGTVLLVSTSVACDMQQDRSTGWRLGTNRVIQFRYQVAGIFMGALLAVGFARALHGGVPGAAARPDGDDGGPSSRRSGTRR